MSGEIIIGIDLGTTNSEVTAFVEGRVALGAGVLASRLSGLSVEKVLVDVSPYSFGIEHLGQLDGKPYEHCYHPIIERNTPLPVTRTDSYTTSVPYQSKAAILVYQGTIRTRSGTCSWAASTWRGSSACPTPTRSWYR
jgi:molecular chaperone DnaK (HSP70)